MVLGAGQRWTSVNLGRASSSLLIIVTQCAHEPPNPNLTSSLGAKFRTTPGCSRPRPWNKLKTTRMRYGSPEYYPGSYLNPGQSRFTREMARVRASRTGLLTSSRLECPIWGALCGNNGTKRSQSLSGSFFPGALSPEVAHLKLLRFICSPTIITAAYPGPEAMTLAFPHFL